MDSRQAQRPPRKGVYLVPVLAIEVTEEHMTLQQPSHELHIGLCRPNSAVTRGHTAQKYLLPRCHRQEVVRNQADGLINVLVGQRWRQRPPEYKVDHLT